MARIQCFQKNHRIVLRYLSNFFGAILVVHVWCINKLGQNRVIP